MIEPQSTVRDEFFWTKVLYLSLSVPSGTVIELIEFGSACLGIAIHMLYRTYKKPPLPCCVLSETNSSVTLPLAKA